MKSIIKNSFFISILFPFICTEQSTNKLYHPLTMAFCILKQLFFVDKTVLKRFNVLVVIVQTFKIMICNVHRKDLGLVIMKTLINPLH